MGSAIEDTARGLKRMGGCLGVTLGVLAILIIGANLLLGVVCFLFDFAFKTVPDFWGRHWRWIVFPVLLWVVFRGAREIGRR